jgi:uncharacterized protein
MIIHFWDSRHDHDDAMLTPPDPPHGIPATLAGVVDDASFDIFVAEERLGTATSAWSADGRFTACSTITVAGQTIETTLRVVPDHDGVWRLLEVVAPDGVRTSSRDGTTVTRVAHVADREQKSTYETPRGAVLFDDAAPALAAHAIRSYDRARGGAQALPLLVGGRPPVTLVLEATERVKWVVADRIIGVTRFRYAVPGTDLVVWGDDAGRALVVEASAQGARFVRDGYGPAYAEASAHAGVAADGDAPSVSRPAFEVVVERGVRVPMRDGVALSTDLYRPAGVARAPVVLARTPYSRAMLELQGRFYARRGYTYAAQDCRGCFDSPGVWEPFVHEGHDGFDAIEWLASQAWADGKVGMIGPSYLASAQWLAAAERPPHLVTIVPNVSPSDPFLGVPYEYGAFALFGNLWWAEVLESRAAAELSGAALSRVSARRRLDALRALPVVDLDVAVLGSSNAPWRAWIAHPTADAFWAPASFLKRLADVDLPVFHQSGWHDDNGLGTKHNYLHMVALGRAHQKLTLGPWGHTDTATRVVGERDFGPHALVDLSREYLRWFDRWLKGVDNRIDREPLVSLFVMGADDWVHDATYPLERTTFRPLYLASGGCANTSRGDGRLTFERPLADAPPDRYVYDPGDPTPATRLYEEPAEHAARVRTADERRQVMHEHRRRVLEERADILVYDTGPLDAPLAFAGPLSAELYAATSARDADWFVTLSQVDADGAVTRLSRGVLRARYRDSFAKPEMVEPGRVYKYTVDCWHTAVRVPAGAHLRVEVASAAFPQFSRNLGTGGHDETESEWDVAQQTVFHDAARPSHVLLPVIPVT